MVNVIVPPCVDDRLRVGDRFEAVHVEALVTETAIETLDKCVLDWLPWPNEVQGDSASIGPFVERLRGEFCAVIHGDGPWQWTMDRQRLERVDDALAGQGDVGLH